MTFAQWTSGPGGRCLAGPPRACYDPPAAITGRVSGQEVDIVSLGGSYRRGGKKRGPATPPTPEEIARRLKELKSLASPRSNYRELSLALHGMICAKCAREFTEKDRHLLTVHHKDGNDSHNPADGSNWENLCVYCHEDEHSREKLSRYFSGDD